MGEQEGRGDAMTRPSCEGVRLSGYWRGWPCGAAPTIERDGHHYCPNHTPEAIAAHEARQEDNRAR